MSYLPNAALMLAHRLRRWPNIKPAFIEDLLFVMTQALDLAIYLVTALTLWWQHG